ncbi:MAG TPA: hypothetical protein VIW69_10510 [Candidatus Elarobacter sp.]
MIDGSNFIGSLYPANLGYPALAPLIAYLVGSDDLSYARFYGAPPRRQPWEHRWRMFVAANRHVSGLDFFEGYRHASNGEEKAGSPVPIAHRAPAGSPKAAVILRGPALPHRKPATWLAAADG